MDRIWRPTLSTFLFLVLSAAVQAQTALSTGISGREAFPGLRIGNVTVGAVFGGWTAADGGLWRSLAENTGGNWFAGISYRGDAREPGVAVDLLDGYWVVEVAGQEAAGTILAGTVEWPEPNDPEWTCFAPSGTYPVAAFTATVGLGQDAEPVGEIRGCLDDIKWDPERPLENIPRIWGTLSVDASALR